MQQPNNVRLSLKIDTLSNWNNSDIILNAGELALVKLDNNQIKVKIGDGTSKLSALNYLNETEFFTQKLSSYNSLFGLKTTAQQYSVAEGHNVSALAAFSHSAGFNSETQTGDNFAFVWNGKNLYGYDNRYKSHGSGTFSLNPENGISGIYIGEDTLASMLNTIYVNGEKTSELQVINISQDDYHALVKAGNTLSNAIYIVSSDMMNMYNERITNLADGISANDAINLNQLCSAISSIDIPEIPTKVSVFENDANYTKLSVDNNSATSFNVKHVSQDEYHTEVINGTDPNTLYIVSSDALNMYSEKIINVLSGTEETDAATVGQIQLSTNTILSELQKYLSKTLSTDEKIDLKSGHLSVCFSGNAVIFNNSGYVEFYGENNGIDFYNGAYNNFYGGGGIYVENLDNIRIGGGDYNSSKNTLADIINNITPKNISELSNDIKLSKVLVDNENIEEFNVKHITQEEYHELVNSEEGPNKNTLYIVSSDTLNMYGERIENVADGISANDAATYGQLSVVENKIETLIHDIQIIKPVYNGKLHLQLTAYINQEMTDVVITSDSLADQKYFAAFLNTSDEQKWIQIENTGVGAEFNNCPIFVKLTDILTDNNQSNKYSKLFICYEWYNLDDDGIKHISDRYSIVVPSHTEVGANSNDYIVTSQFEELASNVRKDSSIVDLEDDKYRCYPYKTNIISNSLTGIVPLILDNYQLNKQYDICFSTGDSKTILEFYYENGINGIEIDDSWNINKNYKFEPNKSYLIKVRQDLIEVVENKYDGSSSSGNHSYKLVSAELSGTTSLSCNIEDRTITTVVVSDSEIPITINFPQKIDGYARDFILRIEVTASEAPEFTFAGLDDSWSVDAEDDEWMFMQPGINIISFTEMK